MTSDSGGSVDNELVRWYVAQGHSQVAAEMMADALLAVGKVSVELITPEMAVKWLSTVGPL